MRSRTCPSDQRDKGLVLCIASLSCAWHRVECIQIIDLSPGSVHYCFHPLCVPRKPLIFCFADILVLCRILWMELLNIAFFFSRFSRSVSFEIIVLGTLLLYLSTAICFLPSEKCTNCVGYCHLLVIFLWVDAGLCWVRLSERKLIGRYEWSTGVSHLSGWPNSVAYSVLKSLENYQTIV